MFEYGIGVKKNLHSSFKCLKEAAVRGNVYAQGNLAVHYYKRKLFNKAADVAKRWVSKAFITIWALITKSRGGGGRSTAKKKKKKKKKNKKI